MGTYDELMKLDKAKKVQRPKPTTPQPSEGVTPILSAQPRTIQPDKSSTSTIIETREARQNKLAGKQAGNHAIKQARYHDSIVELVRKAVRFVGKDPFFGRFTPEEKQMLADIAYTYKRSGMKTSENEIARIAVNFIVSDYKENGENGILSRVLKALNT
jgi:hypothetical protein